MADAINKADHPEDHVEELKGLVGEEISAVKSPANNRRNLVLKSSLMKTDDQSQTPAPDAAAAGTPDAATGAVTPTPGTPAAEGSLPATPPVAPAAEGTEGSEAPTASVVTDLEISAKVIELSSLVEEAGAANDANEQVERVAKCYASLADLAPHVERVAKTTGVIRAASSAALASAAAAAEGFTGERGELIQKSIIKLRAAVTDEDPNAEANALAAAEKTQVEAIRKSWLLLDALATDDASATAAGASSVAGGVQSPKAPSTSDEATVVARIDKWLKS